jgi:4-amino-4-deoxy-L-arabinose transferase-like glycosyltransferase
MNEPAKANQASGAVANPLGVSPRGASSASGDRSLHAVWILAIGVLLARVVYLVWFCRYDLVEDEAHYWLWSRHLDWSYYSKGPGVAWAIWASTRIFGDAEWAVRLPTAVAGAIGALAAGALARDLAADAHDRAGVHGGEKSGAWASPARVGLLAALAYSSVPVLQVSSILMTIDGPYVACWSVACWAFWRAMRPTLGVGGAVVNGFASTMPGAPCVAEPKAAPPRHPGAWCWPLVGGAIALGFLFKYTMLLLVPGLMVFATLYRRERKGAEPTVGGRVCFALGCLLALAGLAPVLIWNAQNGWPTWSHLLGHLGMSGGDMPTAGPADGGSKWSPWWLPELVGEQLGMVGPWLVLAGAMVWRVRDSRRIGRTFLVCAAAPILIFYAAVALIAEPEGNWPMAAYATLLPLAAWAGADALAARAGARSRGEIVERSVRRRILLWRLGLWYAAVAVIPLHTLDVIGDAALALGRRAWLHDASVSVVHREPRDPAGRVRGAREMAGHVGELVNGLRNGTRLEPFVIAQHYGRASQLAYYLPSRSGGGVEVLCAMHQTGGRRSQFDLWPETTLDLPHPELLGRPAVIVTSTQPDMLARWRTMFERVEPIPGERLRGEGKSDRSAYLGYGWKGPSSLPTPAIPGQIPESDSHPPTHP